MSSINRVCLLGKLGRDPEVRQTQAGAKICNLVIATSETWKDKSTGERKEKVEWHKVVIFNDQIAGIAEKYLQKGSRAYVEGALQSRKWVDKDGQERYTTEVVLSQYDGKLVLVDGAQGDGGGNRSGGYQQKPQQQAAPARTDLDDDIPF